RSKCSPRRVTAGISPTTATGANSLLSRIDLGSSSRLLAELRRRISASKYLRTSLGQSQPPVLARLPTMPNPRTLILRMPSTKPSDRTVPCSGGSADAVGVSTGAACLGAGLLGHSGHLKSAPPQPAITG